MCVGVPARLVVRLCVCSGVWLVVVFVCVFDWLCVCLVVRLFVC